MTSDPRPLPVCPGCGGTPDPYPEPMLEGLCPDCADLAVWGAYDDPTDPKGGSA